MCGFAGVVAWEDRFRSTRETLARIFAPISHRGPDGDGSFLNHEQEPTRQRPQAGLVHARLAIIDPDPRANQPFTDGAGKWLVFNGEIYNFKELRRELETLRPDYAWRTNCDTEVLLLGYDAWGEACCERLEGMFAFAVWDEPGGALFLARDRMGQKPLVYMQSAGAFAFASELPALAALPWFESRTDPAAVAEYLRWGYIDEGATIYQGVHKLPPASWRRLDVRGGRTTESSYFDPNARPQATPSPSPDPVEETRRLVRRAVARQLVSDVPLGCFLSGGIDSAVIAAAMKASVPTDQPVLTFSIGFDDPRYDETEYAAAVAQHLGTQHRRFVVRPDAAQDLPKLAKVFGEPFADSSALPTHYLSRETRKHVLVALSGDGGDELFGGYDRYRALALSQRLQRLPGRVRALIASTEWEGLRAVHPRSLAARFRRFASTLDRPAGARYSSYLRLFDAETLSALLRDDFRRSLPHRDRVEETFEKYAAARRDGVQAALATDRVTYLPGDLLFKLDAASMLHALEVRSPFMDHQLVHFAASLPTSLVLGGGSKRLLREAFRCDLPAWVFRRRKMGFAVPIGDWLRAGLREMLNDLLFATHSFASSHFDHETLRRLLEEHQAQRADHSQRLYALLMLELWWSDRRATP